MDKTIFLLFTAIVAAQGREIVSLSSRIVGGERASLEDFPFQAVINEGNNNYRCTGAVKSAYWIITTCTCLYGMVPEKTTVFAGTIKRYFTWAIRDAVKFVRHPNFNLRTSLNDIALIKIHRELEEESGELEYVNLPLPNRIVPEAATVTVTGWGSTTHRGDFNVYLQKLDMMVISNKMCTEALGPGMRAYDSQICTIGIDKNKLQGPCNGDNGGPLMEKDTMVGLMSSFILAPDCGNPNEPTIFTRVSSFVDWINSNVD